MWGLHQIRYNVDIRPYDWIWNVIAAIMIIVGIILIVRTQTHVSMTKGSKS